MTKKRNCIKCSCEFKPDELLRDPQKKYCPYCDVVYCGPKDSTWLPSIVGDDERKVRGFHEV